VAQLLDIREPHPLTSLNMVVCLNNKDLNQPGRWLTSSLQASSLVPSKVVMAVHQLSPQVNMPNLKCNMEVLPALVDTAVVSPPQILNGVLPLLRATATASVATRDSLLRSLQMYELSGFAIRVFLCGISGYRFWQCSLFFLHLLFSCLGLSPYRLGRLA
jgi:uncharacterized membrane protein